MTLAQDIIDRNTALVGLREPWDSVWSDVAPFVDPMNEAFGAIGETSFDSHPRRAVVRFASTAQSYLIPEGQRWHSLKPIEEKLFDNTQVKRFSDEMTKLLFRWRYDPQSGFQPSMGSAYNSLGMYGATCTFLEELFGGDVPFRYQKVPITEVYPSINSAGQVDELHRRYKLTAKALVEKFKDNGKLPQKIIDYANDAKNKDTQFEIIHAVMPRTSDKGRFGFESIYIAVDDKKLIRKSGFYEFPYMFSSLGSVDGKTPFGYCPAIDALPDMRGASHALRLMLRAAEKAIDPPIATHDDLEIVLELNAGSMTPGLMNRQGQQLFMPIQSGAQPGLGKEILDFMHDSANGSFYGDLLLAVAGQDKQMTAQEALLRAQEKGSVIGPFFGNQEAMHARGVKRELAILARKQQSGEIELPEVPEIMRRHGGLDLEWNSPLSQLRKSGQAAGTMQFISAVGDIAQVYPEVVDRVDSDEAIKLVGDAMGAPSKVIRSDDEVERIRKARAQQQQAQAQEQQQAQQAQNARNVAPLVQAIGAQNG